MRWFWLAGAVLFAMLAGSNLTLGKVGTALFQLVVMTIWFLNWYFREFE